MPWSQARDAREKPGPRYQDGSHASPGNPSLSDDEYRDFCRGLCDEIVAEARGEFGPDSRSQRPCERIVDGADVRTDDV